MIATDLWLDDNFASDFGLMIASIGGSNDDVASGGDIEFSVAKPPNRDRFKFYTSQINEPLSWNISLIKDACKYDNSEMTFDSDEERKIMKWLLRTDGYRWMRFVQENPEDTFYHVNVNAKPNQVRGETVGFDVVITADCGYGFSKLLQKEITINSTTSKTLSIDTDLNEYVYPEITINGSGSFYIYNENDLEQTVSNNRVSSFNNITSGTEIIMDSENEIVSGVNTGQFNFYFLRLLDGENVIKTNSISDITLKFQYREARRVVY